MTDAKGSREPGYRGALPPRVDRLAPVWVLAVAGILVLVFVLSVLGVPSRLFPEPTPIPVPSVSAAPSPSGEPSASPSGSVVSSPSPQASTSPTLLPSASPAPT